MNLFLLQALHTAESTCISDLNSNSEQLKIIEQKIANKNHQLSQPTTFAGAKELSRHEMDLEKAVTRDRDSSKVFHCLVTDKSVDSVSPDHPINHLEQIWKDVLSSKATCRKRKRKRVATVIADDGASCEVSTKVDSGCVSEETVSKCLHHAEAPVKSATHERVELLSSDHCTQKKCDITPDHCTQKKCDITPVPVEVIERYRLSVDQIKQLPRFQNYCIGTPSPVC